MIKLVHGDCMGVMKEMLDASVDAIVTDPPFGIGFIYGNAKEAASNPDEYWQWFEPFYKEMVRVLRPGGLFACWQAQLYFRHFWEWFGDNIHIYVIAKNFVPLRHTPINYAYDPVVMFYKGGALPRRPDKPPRSVDFFVANTAGLVSNVWALEKGHPSPKPLDGICEIIRNFVAEGGLILDPFVGSGTTLVAARRTNRQAIGIEISEEYCSIVRKRLEREVHFVGEQIDLPIFVDLAEKST